MNKQNTILRILSDQDGKGMYGLDLVAKSNGKLSRGTVYVFLSSMETSGVIESRYEVTPPGFRGLPRRLYKITSTGKEAMKD